MATNFSLMIGLRNKYLEIAVLLALIGTSVGITYWLQEAQYKKQETALQQEIQGLKKQVQDLEGQNLVLQKRSEQVEACILNLRSSIGGLQNNLQDSLSSHPNLNLLGEGLNTARNLLFAPNDIWRIVNTWRSENCRTAQLIVTEQGIQP